MDKATVIQQLKCTHCANPDGAVEYYFYEQLDNIISWFPEKNLIHIHFGKPTWNDEITVKEAEWLRDSCLDAYKKAGHPLFAIADFSQIDDSEFPTKEAIKLYAETANHEMSAHIVCYGVSLSMKMILTLISGISTAAAKISFEPSMEKSMDEFAAWSKKTTK